MPSLRVHEYIDRLYLGKSYPKLHRYLDKPVFFLGRHHRILFHDYATAYFVASRLYPGDSDALTSAELHIYFDEVCTADPEYRKFLEEMAKLDKQKRKATRKRRKKKKPEQMLKRMESDEWKSMIRFLKFYIRLRSRRSKD